MNKMRGVILASLVVLFAVWTTGTAVGQTNSTTIVAYTYSSFASYGAADVVTKAFRRATGATVQFVATGDDRTMLSKLIAERAASGTAPADVFVGVEMNDAGVANRNNVFDSITVRDVPNLASVPAALRFDPSNRLIPYEHGFITVEYDTRYMGSRPVPRSFADLLKPAYRKSLIVEDPRTSGPGLSFLLWTIAHFGESGYVSYWQKLMPNILTVTSSWDTAFELFSKGEAPMMVSFSTDRAYDVIANHSDTIRVQPLDGEAYRTIYGMGVVKGTHHPRLAHELLNVILSPSVQAALPETEWMIPASRNAPEPEAFKRYTVVPSNPVAIDMGRVDANLSSWINSWVNNVLGG